MDLFKLSRNDEKYIFNKKFNSDNLFFKYKYVYIMESNNLLASFELVHKKDIIDMNILNELMKVFERLHKSIYLPKYLYFDEITLTYGDFTDKYLKPSSKDSVYMRTFELYNELKDLGLFEDLDHLDSFGNGKIRIKSEDGNLKTLIKIRTKYSHHPNIYISLTLVVDHKKHLRLNIYCDDNSDLTGKLIILNQE